MSGLDQRPGLARALVLGFAAEALVFPAGLITTAFLTRKLGAASYGEISLVYAAVAPVMWAASMVFGGRAAVKILSDSANWQPNAAALVRASLVIGVLGMGLFALCSPILGTAFRQPSLTPLFWLAAPEILLMPVTRLHRDALTARGRYMSPALATASYHGVRLVMILVLVTAGWSVAGVIAANLMARLAELSTCRVQQPLPFRGARAGALAPMRELLGSLFVYALLVQIFNRVDLLLVGRFTSAETVGHYGAAQNLAQAPGLLALVLTPMLIAAIRRAELAGAGHEAAGLRLESARLALGLWAMAAAVAGGAPRLAVLLLGSSFAPSGPILVWLGLAGGGMLVMSVLAAHEVAAGRYGQPLIAAGPMLAVGVVLQIVLIPRYGGTGAAIATAAGATLGALIALGFDGGRQFRAYGLDLLRAVGGGASGYAATMLAGAAHVPSPVDIAAGCLVSGLTLVVLRLISLQDVVRFASELTGRRSFTSTSR